MTLDLWIVAGPVAACILVGAGQAVRHLIDRPLTATDRYCDEADQALDLMDELDRLGDTVDRDVFRRAA